MQAIRAEEAVEDLLETKQITSQSATQETSTGTRHGDKLDKSSHRDHRQRDSRSSSHLRITPRSDPGGKGNGDGRRRPPGQ